MTEAWLLIDEGSIRLAAGNPNGVENLDLPDIRTLEDVPDKKDVPLHALLRASGLNARRRSQFRPHQRIYLSSDFYFLPPHSETQAVRV